MENHVATIKNLKKSFGSNIVLNDIHLFLNKGENLVVLGKSGSGKSVLIKCMAGLLKPDKGDIEILNEKILTLNKIDLNILRKKIGFLFQSGALYDSMSVRENLEFPLRAEKNISKDEIKERVLESLKNVGLEDAIDKLPAELSGGMRKRVGLARTLMLKPEIIFYDEPTTGLDPITAREISQLILSIQKKYNTASIIITHDIECTELTSNRIIILKDGMIAAEGIYSDLSKSNDKWILSFFKNTQH